MQKEFLVSVFNAFAKSFSFSSSVLLAIISVLFQIEVVFIPRLKNLSSSNSGSVYVVAGTSVKHVLQQDKAAFVRLVGVSVLQSGVSSFLAPSLRSMPVIFADYFKLDFYSLYLFLKFASCFLIF